MQFSAAARRALGEYTWPGNVRELENAIERAVILADSDHITPELLALHPGGSGDPPSVPGDSAQTAVPQLSLEEYFKAFVQAHQGRMSETQIAERLGISRKALWERRQRLELPRPKH
jgi:DNA-binding NtrC family response regulator